MSGTNFPAHSIIIIVHSSMAMRINTGDRIDQSCTTPKRIPSSTVTTLPKKGIQERQNECNPKKALVCIKK